MHGQVGQYTSPFNENFLASSEAMDLTPVLVTDRSFCLDGRDMCLCIGPLDGRQGFILKGVSGETPILETSWLHF